jgi:predicted cupin superfamily sugar epimerase
MHEALINRLALEPHPEGGFYRRTFFSESPSFSSILFLLVTHRFSAFHKIGSDEQWNWYQGDDIILHEINPSGKYATITLSGKKGNENFQHIVKAGNWFASECSGEHGYALCGCTVVPAFSFDNFKMADRNELTRQFPRLAAVITRLTRL